VPVFVHVLLPQHEVVIRVRALAVDGSAELLAALEARFGPGAIRVDYA
jgi:hypothetical protein